KCGDKKCESDADADASEQHEAEQSRNRKEKSKLPSSHHAALHKAFKRRTEIRKAKTSESYSRPLLDAKRDRNLHGSQLRRAILESRRGGGLQDGLASRLVEEWVNGSDHGHLCHATVGSDCRLQADIAG